MKFPIFLAMFALVSCASHHRLSKVEIGQSYGEVVEIKGLPNGCEELETKQCLWDEQGYEFKDNKLVGIVPKSKLNYTVDVVTATSGESAGQKVYLQPTSTTNHEGSLTWRQYKPMLKHFLEANGYEVVEQKIMSEQIILVNMGINDAGASYVNRYLDLQSIRTYNDTPVQYENWKLRLTSYGLRNELKAIFPAFMLVFDKFLKSPKNMRKSFDWSEKSIEVALFKKQHQI